VLCSRTLNRSEEIGDLFSPVLTLKQSLPESVTAAVPAKSLSKGTTALRECERKRDSRRPANREPRAPRASAQGSRKRFVVQKHAIKAAGKARLLSRRNNSLGGKFPAIQEALENLEDGLILDGEIIAMDAEGRQSFNLLQHHRENGQAIVFMLSICSHTASATCERWRSNNGVSC
jgi:hypothetical protein